MQVGAQRELFLSKPEGLSALLDGDAESLLGVNVHGHRGSVVIDRLRLNDIRVDTTYDLAVESRLFPAHHDG